jgi:hypothetical protein
MGGLEPQAQKLAEPHAGAGRGQREQRGGREHLAAQAGCRQIAG